MRALRVFAGLFVIGLLGILYVLHQDAPPPLPEAPTNTPEARARWEFERTKDPVTGKMPPGIKSGELAFARELAKQSIASKTQSTLTWTQMGPDTLGGRTRALAIDVTDGNTILAGAVSGGIWKSTDGGANWSQTLTPTQLLSVTTIAQDTRSGQEDTWYAGTGEYTGNSASATGATFFGDGIYKSTDGGDSWTLLSSTSTGVPQSFDNLYDFVWRVATDPSNGSQPEVYAAAIWGIFRSVDGGTSWTQVLSSTNSYHTDVVVSSTGVVYAALGEPGTNAGIWRSADGVTWTDITPGGWSSNTTRTALALAPSNEDVLYTISYTSGDGTHDTSIWKYTHSTTTWEDRSANVPSFGGFQDGNFDSQGGYDLHVAVKPDNENTVYIGGTSLYRSTDGFSTTSNIDWIAGYSFGTDNWSGTHHADQHIAIFSTSDPDVMYTGSDGGVHRTDDVTAATVHWVSLNRGYLSGQFYSVGIDHTSSTNMALMGGTQDNGTWYIDDPGSSTLGEEIWGGDGAFVANLNDGDLRYASFQNGQIYRLTYSSNSLTSWALVTTSLTSSYSFIHPYTLDPNDSDIMYLPGGDRMYRNSSLTSIPNYTSSAHTTGWQELSNTVISGGGVISAVMASESNPDHRVYYGTSTGRVYVLDNADTGNPSPSDVTDGSFPSNANVSSITIHPDDADRVMVTFSNYFVQSIWYSDDGGSSWTDVSGSLEENTDGSGNGPSVRWAKMGVISGSSAQYFVGTSTGLYSTTTLNGTSTTWTQEGTSSIGNVVIDMIDIRNSDGYVAVGTHGNGFYTSTLNRPTATAGPGGVTSNLQIWYKADAGVYSDTGCSTSLTSSDTSDALACWEDQSGNATVTSQSSAGPRPDHNTSGQNYNPTFSFDESEDDLLDFSSFPISSPTDIHAYYVIDENDGDGDDYIIGSTAGTNNRFYLRSTTAGFGAAPSNNATPASGFYLATADYDLGTTTMNFSVDAGTPISASQTWSNTLSSPYKLGAYGSSDGRNSHHFNGEIAEIIIYDADPSGGSDEQKIQSYLGLKWGLSLPIDYLASDGTTLWNATTNSTYHNGVAGIGRDDASTLNQKQTDSDRLTVALSSLAANNASNSNTFSTDLSFLILGHDNGGLTESSVTISSVTGQLLGRTWFAEETNEAGTLEVQFDLSSLSITGTEARDFYLVLDTNSDPTDGYRELVAASSFASDIATFSSIDIEDGDYVMILTSFEAGKTDPPLTDGQGADGVLGQSSFSASQADNGGVSASSTDGPSYVAVGPTGKLFASDTDNNRVLRWASVAAASNGASAEAVLGQASFSASSTNRGGSVAANTMYEPHGVYVSSSGALYVADTRNNRVLRFDNAESATSGASADAVLGQADFTSSDPNRGGTAAANTLRWPMDLHVDGSGNLWVADWLNHRVLRFDNVAAKSDGASADGVLGQDALTTSLRMWKDNTDADSFVFPSGVCVDDDGVLWVADTGNSRILRFDNAPSKADGADADGVLGQPDFTSWQTTRGTGSPAANTLQWPEGGLDVDQNGRLWVADRWGDRVLWYHNAASKSNGADADGLIGQGSFTSRNGSVNSSTFNGVTDVLVDESNDYVWVVDNNHNRILRFDGSDLALGKTTTRAVAEMMDFWLIAGKQAYANQEVTRLAAQDDEVHVWLDQSRHQFTALADSPPVFVENAINGYPAIEFGSGNARMRIEGGLFGEANLDNATVWAVIKDENAFPEEPGFTLSLQSKQSARSTTGVKTVDTQLQTTTHSSTTNLFLGDIALTSGTIAEFMASFKTPSDSENRIFASYLAIKYGLPFEQNYISAIGDTLWDQTLQEKYSAGIAGIGRSDDLGLMHPISKAAGEDQILTIRKPVIFSDSLNAEEAFEFDQTYILWGHNDGSLSIEEPTHHNNAAYRMGRTWYVRETGIVDSLQVRIPAGTKAEYLLLDATEAFSNPAIIRLGYNKESKELVAHIDIKESGFLTFASSTPYTGYGASPKELVLYQNYPNPFNPTTTLRFDLPQDAHTSMEIFDLLGRRVQVLINDEMLAGSHSITFDAAGLASGVYFYRIRVNDEVQTMKMLLAK